LPTLVAVLAACEYSMDPGMWITEVPILSDALLMMRSTWRSFYSLDVTLIEIKISSVIKFFNDQSIAWLVVNYCSSCCYCRMWQPCRTTRVYRSQCRRRPAPSESPVRQSRRKLLHRRRRSVATDTCGIRWTRALAWHRPAQLTARRPTLLPCRPRLAAGVRLGWRGQSLYCRRLHRNHAPPTLPRELLLYCSPSIIRESFHK